MKDHKPPREFKDLQISDDLIKNSEIYSNIKQEIVITTVDKLKLYLIKHEESSKSRREWIAPFGTLFALLTSLVTSDFNNFLGFTPITWQTLYIVTSILVALWLLKALKDRHRPKDSSNIDDVIEQIKTGVD